MIRVPTANRTPIVSHKRKLERDDKLSDRLIGQKCQNLISSINYNVAKLKSCFSNAKTDSAA